MGKIYTTKFYKGTRIYERPASEKPNGAQAERIIENEVDEKELQAELTRRLLNHKNVIIRK